MCADDQEQVQARCGYQDRYARRRFADDVPHSAGSQVHRGGDPQALRDHYAVR